MTTETSRTDRIAANLLRYPDDTPIVVISGEINTASGRARPFTWKRNARAVILAIARECDQGQRWAKVLIKDGPLAGCNLETGELETFDWGVRHDVTTG